MTEENGEHVEHVELDIHHPEAEPAPVAEIVHDPIAPIHDRLGTLERRVDEHSNRFASAEHEHPDYATHEEVGEVVTRVPGIVDDRIQHAVETAAHAPDRVEEVVLEEPRPEATVEAEPAPQEETIYRRRGVRWHAETRRMG